MATNTAVFQLRDSCVDVWKVSLTGSDEDFTRANGMLSVDEKERAARIGSVRMQRAFVLARAGLRSLLGHYIRQAPDAICFSCEPQGRPRLCGDNGIYFSATRSGELAAFALCASPSIGIDIERRCTVAHMDRVVERMFSPAEKRQLEPLDHEMRLRAFFACWTRKEAYAKALGEGILTPFEQFSVDVNPNEAKPEIRFEMGQEVNDWVLHDLRFGDEYAAALAYRGAGRTITVYDAGSVGELFAMESDGSDKLAAQHK
jgi:4'-phosphopantetheinyl transferase